MESFQRFIFPTNGLCVRGTGGTVKERRRNAGCRAWRAGMPARAPPAGRAPAPRPRAPRPGPWQTHTRAFPGRHAAAHRLLRRRRGGNALAPAAGPPLGAAGFIPQTPAAEGRGEEGRGEGRPGRELVRTISLKREAGPGPWGRPQPRLFPREAAWLPRRPFPPHAPLRAPALGLDSRKLRRGIWWQGTWATSVCVLGHQD